MKFKTKLFAFISSSSGKTIAVIQAADSQTARGRAHLISHITKIPADCMVKEVKRGTVLRAPVFFEGHFLALEDALADA